MGEWLDICLDAGWDPETGPIFPNPTWKHEYPELKRKELKFICHFLSQDVELTEGFLDWFLNFGGEDFEEEELEELLKKFLLEDRRWRRNEARRKARAAKKALGKTP